MRVFYRSVPNNRDPIFEQAGPMKFCCAGMCERWQDVIAFGVVGHPRSTSRDVNLCVMRPQANGRAIVEVIPFQFCPFCGEQIETIRVK